MTKHILKIWPEYFEAVAARRKKFELRKNDRDFKEGDHLILKEFDPQLQDYTGRSAIVVVTYVLKAEDTSIACLGEGFACMSIDLISMFKQNLTDLGKVD